MDKHSVRRSALSLAVMLAMSGCSVHQDKREIDELSADTYQSTSSRVSQNMRTVTLEQKRANQIVDLPFLAAEPRPIPREADLPLVLQGKIPITSVFSDGGETDLLTFAKRVQDASGVLVRVSPDALLPLSQFGPSLNKENRSTSVTSVVAQQTTSANTLDLNGPIVPIDAESVPVNPPPALSTAAGSVTATPPQSGKGRATSRRSKDEAGQQQMNEVLDRGTAPLGVYWKWDELAHQVVIYRTETRMFEIRGAENAVRGKIETEQTGTIGEQTGNSSINSKSGNLVEQAKVDGTPMLNIIKNVKQFMTRSGQVAEGTSNVIIVTDTRDALDQIQRYVDLENKERSRSVEMVFEEITFEFTNSEQGGVNYNLIFDPTGKGNETTINGLNSLLEQEGAAASLGIKAGSGPLKGSSIAVQALSKVGKVINTNFVNLGSNNGVAVTKFDPEDQEYPDKLQQTASTSDNQRPTTSVTQATKTWGRFLTIIPYLYSNGDANLTFKWDNKPTPRFDKNTFADGGYVISPRSSGTILARQARLHSGQPHVVLASTVRSDGYNANRVDRNAPIGLGGSDVTDHTNRMTLLILTAMVKEQ
jgi:uncharacterized protein YceK